MPMAIVQPPNAGTHANNPDGVRLLIEHTPLGRAGKPEDIVGPAIFLASDLSAYVTGPIVMAAGDCNVAQTDLDIYPTRSWDKDALIQPKSRAAFKALLAQGWTDAIRALHPSKPMFTFWDYKRNRWPRDAGLRLDHLLLSPALAPRLLKAGVDRNLRGEEGASDHAPAWIVLR
jgi:exodeoxyribonuclease III